MQKETNEAPNQDRNKSSKGNEYKILERNGYYFDDIVENELSMNKVNTLVILCNSSNSSHILKTLVCSVLYVGEATINAYQIRSYLKNKLRISFKVCVWQVIMQQMILDKEGETITDTQKGSRPF